MAPVKTFRSSIAYGVQIAVWESEKGHNFTVSKSYKDKGGNWQESSTFFPADLAALKELVGRALAWSDENRKAPGQKSATEQRMEKAGREFKASDAAPAFDDDDIPFA